LSSDGLDKNLLESEIAKTFKEQGANPENAAKILLGSALDNMLLSPSADPPPDPDNASIIVARI
jgi:hypothetical protein